MVWMRMIEANNVEPSAPCLLLDPDQLLRRYVIAIVSGVGARILRRDRVDNRVHILFDLTQQHPAALVRIGLFPVPANGIILRLVHA
jgi:hypothetical protein